MIDASDIINVRDYGATGLGVVDDGPSIQAALDAAFGSASSPNGSANAHLNKPVFFPCGNYNVGAPLVLTRVVGGWVFGSGSLSTRLQYIGSVAGGATITSLIRSNGLARCSFQNMNLSIFGTNTCCFNLDWDNTSGGDGLHSNMFKNMVIESATNGIIIANAGNGGWNNSFINVGLNTLTSAGAGMDVRGSSARGNVVVSGGGIANIIYKCSGGGLSINGVSVEATDVAIEVSADVDVSINGGRTESANTLRISNGRTSIRSFTTTVAGVFANVTGGKLLVDGCNLTANGSNTTITGNAGSLYLRGNLVNAGFHSGYSGTVSQEI